MAMDDIPIPHIGHHTCPQLMRAIADPEPELCDGRTWQPCALARAMPLRFDTVSLTVDREHCNAIQQVRHSSLGKTEPYGPNVTQGTTTVDDQRAVE